MSDADRLLSKTRKTSNGCLEWTAHRMHAGYGLFWLRGKTRRAHRAAYELFIGLIPDGLQLDHLCGNRACVNPDHLEPVSARENTLRGGTLPAENYTKSACVNGHAFDANNTWLYNGIRHCRTCRRAAVARYDQRQRLAAANALP